VGREEGEDVVEAEEEKERIGIFNDKDGGSYRCFG